jgi:hypothetical protein
MSVRALAMWSALGLAAVLLSLAVTPSGSSAKAKPCTTDGVRISRLVNTTCHQAQHVLDVYLSRDARARPWRCVEYESYKYGRCFVSKLDAEAQGTRPRSFTWRA